MEVDITPASHVNASHTTDLMVDAVSISTPREQLRPTLSTSRDRKTIHDLPAELFLIIFGQVYTDLYQPRLSWDEDQQDDSELTQWATSCSLFAYAPASVCSFWRDVMVSIPKVWWHVVPLVDPPATPLPSVGSHLSSSHDHQLEVTVTSRRTSHEHVDAEHEHSQIIAILDILGARMHRIRKLRLNVTFSSSLPAFPSDYCGAATSLERLEIRCKEDDGVRTSVAPTDHEEFTCPKLRSLVVDGRDYYEECKRDAQWTQKIASVMTLTISHFKPNLGESFTLHELLLPLTNLDLETLRITDVVLSPSPVDLEIPWLQFVEFLEFEDLHDCRIMHQIIHLLCIPSYISFTRCTLEDFPFALGPFAEFVEGELALAQINSDLAPILRLLNHRRVLTITDCPAFDDTLLDIMGTEEDGTFWCAQSAQDLTITDCPNFSVTALRRFVASRLVLPPLVLHQSDMVPTRIQRLHVSGNVPSISQDDRAWFSAHVPRFCYR